MLPLTDAPTAEEPVPAPTVAASPAIGRTALRLAPVALVARGVAFVGPMVVARLYGVSPTTDAFFWAQAIPTFVMVIVANAFAVTAVPHLAKLPPGASDETDRFVGGAMVTSSLSAVTVGALALAALWPLMPLITAFSPDQRRLAWTFVAELLPLMGLIGAGVILRATAEVRGRFLRAATAPMLRGSTVIALLFALKVPLGAHALPAALVLGQCVEVGWLLSVVVGAGVVPRPTAKLDDRLRAALVAVLPVLVGEVLVAANVLTDRAFAGLLPEGAVSHLEYADRTRFIPQTLLESTLLPVAYATWSNLLARGDRAGFARWLDQSFRWVVACAAPPLAGLFVGRHVLVALLYQRGEFTAADADAAAGAFGCYVPGLWPMMLGTLAMRAHVAEGRQRVVLWLGVVSVVLNALFDALLYRPLGVNGVALGSTLVWVVVPGLYVAMLAPTLREAFDARKWLPAGLVAAGSVTVAAVVESMGAPRSLSSPALWAAAVACFALLGLAARVTRPEAP